MEKLTKSPRLEKLLHQMDIYSMYDVVFHLPRRYDDYSLSRETSLEDKQRVVLHGKVISAVKVSKSYRTVVVSFDFMSDNSRYYHIVAFNRQYLDKTININEDYTLTGIYNHKKNEIDLINIVKGQIDLNKHLRPIYSLPKDYPNHLYISLVERCLKALEGKIYTLVPFYFVNKYRLVNKETAIKYAHSPRNYEDIRQSLRYLKYEEALMFSLKNQIIRELNRSMTKIKKEPIDFEICKPFVDTLPYTLTDDQAKACEEIIEDMNQSSTMYRMLQGDVGSGKTLVAFIALYANYLRGDQGALMAPTDALARQHYQKALEIFKDTKIRIALLVGATKQSDKERIYDDLKDGYIDIVIGTHALFTKAANYSSLGLVVVDEQHRFGVNQRIALASKGDHADMLMMSATPIPRSLALTLYGDLDISSLMSFPALKRDVKTEIIDSENERIYQLIDKSLKENRQVYVVAPLIDFREDERYSVEQLYARYVLKYGKKVGLLHGKMKANEKEEALLKFYKNETPILVTTSVIEVGIDVKTSNLMIIYDASNFGLASLHQLRGRIGRDGSPSICLLTHDEEDDEVERLQILCDSNDGFEIAEADLKARGPGELTGVKQAGLPDFAYLNVVNDFRIFVTARDDAKYILDNPDNKGFGYIIERAKKEINEENTQKG